MNNGNNSGPKAQVEDIPELLLEEGQVECQVQLVFATVAEDVIFQDIIHIIANLRREFVQIIRINMKNRIPTNHNCCLPTWCICVEVAQRH
jgi:hypothetical protein